jgi:hypothetical protein
MKKYTATLSFVDAKRSFRRTGVYELNEAYAAEYVGLGWLIPVAAPAPAKRATKKKVERATAPAVDTATLDS